MKIDIVRDDDGDWAGIYIDDKLYHESHSLQDTDILDAIGATYEITFVNIEEGGRLPHDFSEALKYEV